MDTRILEMHGINWTDVNIDDLIELGENVNVLLRGVIKLSKVDDKQKLLKLKELFGNNIFNKESDLYIYGPNAIYVFGESSILEGQSCQFETIVFSDEDGILLFNISSGEREGVAIDRNTGLFTSVENAEPTVEFNVRVVYILSANRLIDDSIITVEKRVYPESVGIEGPTRISEEITTFTWYSPTQNITGEYIAE